MVASKRLVANPALIDRAIRQVQLVLFKVQSDMERREEALVDELDRSFTDDPKFADLLRRYVVTEAEVFGGHPTGLQLDGDRIGMERGFIRENN